MSGNIYIMVVAYSTFKQAGTWSDIIIQDLEKVGCSNYRGSTDGERSRSTLDNHGHIQYLRQYKKYKCEGSFFSKSSAQTNVPCH